MIQPYLGALCASHQAGHLPAELAGRRDGAECDGGQLVIVVLGDHQGTLEPLEEARLWEDSCG